MHLFLELDCSDYEDMITAHINEALEAVHITFKGAELAVTDLREILSPPARSARGWKSRSPSTMLPPASSKEELEAARERLSVLTEGETQDDAAPNGARPLRPRP